MRVDLIEKQLVMLPGPTNVDSRVMRALAHPIISHRGEEFHELHSKSLERAKHVFQTRNDLFILTSSGTGGIECAVSNVVSPGDKILVSVQGVFGQRLKEKVEAFGGEPVEVQVEWGKAVTAEQVAKAAEGQEIDAIAVTYNETSTGVTMRGLSKLGEIAREHDALLMVDAISILGGDELPVDEWGIDICVTGSQKCLAAPPGLALISVSERAWKVIERTKSNPYYFNLLKMRDFLEQKMETPFTPALSLFFALNEALAMIEEEGLEDRIKRHRDCARRFYEGVQELGLEPFADEGCRSNTVIAVKNPEEGADEKFRKIMREKHNVLVAGGMGELKGKIFRIGCMGMVSEHEVSATLEALENALKELGYLK